MQKETRITCFYDNDPAGKKAVIESAKILGRQIFAVQYSEDCPPGYDPNDLLKAGQGESIKDMIENAFPVEAPQEMPKQIQPSTQTEILLDFASQGKLFHTPDGEAYARIEINGHYETHPVKSTAYRNYLRHRFYKLEKKAPGAKALKDALGTIEAIAQFDGDEVHIYLRTAYIKESQSIYIDLGNDKWEVIEITKAGWKIISDPPVHFKRPPGMRAMVTPKRGGSLDKLRHLLNLGEGREGHVNWVLIIAWVIKALIPDGPYPVLSINGEQGSSKSTTCRTLKRVVDSHDVPLRSMPRNIEDLAIAANSNHAPCFDNTSGMEPWLSDGFACIATGGGLAGRKYYTNDEEFHLRFMCPVIINGINSIIYRNDLADRSIFITLPSIPPENRSTESDINKKVEKALPGIMGGLFDAISVALQNREKVRIKNLPRMADFATWVVAAEPALPWEPGDFLKMYDWNRASIIENSIDSDYVASAIRKMVEKMYCDDWSGTSSELLEKIGDLVDDKTRFSKFWPKDSTRLSKHLRRVSTFLRLAGIDVLFDTPHRRQITIRKVDAMHDATHDANSCSDTFSVKEKLNDFNSGCRYDANDATGRYLSPVVTQTQKEENEGKNDKKV